MNIFFVIKIMFFCCCFECIENKMETRTESQRSYWKSDTKIWCDQFEIEWCKCLFDADESTCSKYN